MLHRPNLIIILSLMLVSSHIISAIPVFQNSTRPSLQGRDNHGCDALISSCGENGACCDIHDQCYQTHSCTYSTWFTADQTISQLNESLATYTTVILLLQKAGAATEALEASRDNLIKLIAAMDACRQCNYDVMSCVVNSNPGPSTCCTDKTCGQPRPK